MILLGISKYPVQSAKEVTKRFMEMARLPEYIKGKGNYAYTDDAGVVALVFYEFDSAKADKAIEEINNAYWRFYDIPGHSHRLIPVFKAREAAKKFLEFA
jgi:hypothetical protein